MSRIGVVKVYHGSYRSDRVGGCFDFRSLLLLFFLLTLPGIGRGEWMPRLNFRHYTIDDGLSVNAVYSITQDSKGYMWFGTINGLNRFDGRNFSAFRSTDDSVRLSLGNVIYAIEEDNQERLWVASNLGVCIFDLKTETFLPFDVKTAAGESITSRVYAVVKDREQHIWIGTFGQGLFRYSPESGLLVQFKHNPVVPTSICSDYIRRIYEDAAGKIWFTSLDQGIGVFHSESDGFTNYNPTGGTERVRNESIFEDSQRNLWIGNDQYGLIRMDRATETFVSYLTPESPQHVMHIRSITEYSPGILLLASDDGLTFFNVQTGEAKTLTVDMQDLKGLNDRYLHALFVDKEKGLWIGSYFGGVNYVSLAYNNFTYYGHSQTENSLPGKIISAFCEDPDGNLWIGTDDAGLSFFDVKREHFTNYKPIKNRNSLSYQNIHALLWENNEVWIGTYSAGLDILNLKTGRFRNYRSGNGERLLCSSGIYALYKDKSGTIWVGTMLGLNRYHRESDDFSRIEVLDGKDVTCIDEDNGGNLWVSTFGSGIYCLKARTREWRNYSCSDGLPTNQVSTICVDDNGRLWIGTDGGGICRFDYDTDRMVPCVHTDFAGSVIHKIIADYEYLWISTNNGLIKYQPDKNTTQVYTKSDGLQNNQFSPCAGIKSADGRLWFGGINGLNSFYPRKLVENKQAPKVVLTNLKLFNKEVSCRDTDSPLECALGYTRHLTLNHHQSIFSIEFVALSFTAPLKNKYAYKLDGFEQQWTIIHGDPKASYTNLSAGDYYFRVRASNGDGVWNNEETVLKLTVLPPFWRSKLAYMLYLMLFVSFVIYTYHRLIKRTEKEHLERMEHLKVEKEKELYNAKVNFFTNIIHEIRTPLSLIMGPLSSVMKSGKTVDEVHDELAVIERNSNRLLHLVNQLMDFRKIEAEGFLLKLEKHELNEWLKPVCDNFTLIFRERKMNFELHLPEEKSIVNVDLEALTKVASNLLFNAVKYTKDRVRVELVRHEGLMQVDLRVADNGIGIPEEEQEKIFKPFYRMEHSSHSGISGSGIGLTLAKSLTESMNGSLFIEQGQKEGTVFVLRLPLFNSATPVAETPPLSAEETPDEAIEEVTGRVRNLLVVDDHEELRTFLVEQLNLFYHILSASDGAQALQMLEENSVDLIISDVMMPGMDGFELCRLVKTNIKTSHIPVILLTAKANIDAKITGLESGADVYIEKPFSVEYLRAQTNSLLLNRERLRQRFINMPFITSDTIAMSKADRELLQKMDAAIDKSLAESEFSVEDLAGILCMSRSTLFEKIKNVSGLTPNNYIRLARLKKAAEILAKGEYHINEVGYLVGFSSASYFAKCFKKQFGVLPTDFVGKKTAHS